MLSEESGRSGDGDRIVVVDPLDGSTNASRGMPWFATSLCVVDERGPAVALVANQATGERLEAVRGAGRVDRRAPPRRRRAARDLGGAVVGISGLPPSAVVGLVAVPRARARRPSTSGSSPPGRSTDAST